MKAKVFLIVLLFLPLIAVGQNSYYGGYKPGVDVKPPVFTGVENVNVLMSNSMNKTINEYLSENVKCFNGVVECYEEGTEVIRFVIDENGSPKNFTVINSISASVDQEFIRILKQTEGMWIPGSNNGTPVEMEKEVSMAFVSSKFKDADRYLTNRARSVGHQADELLYVKDKPARALRRYDVCLKYRPYETAPLLSRGICKYKLGDKEGARRDWERINEIGKIDASLFIKNLIDFEGYDEMVLILNK